ncbi:hypothetical protein ABG768_008207 [Culter alburnus]|uniref:Uncharacterized protein n=1 Tax=Culter alburnus TaxID=194366 RepID=A0AAW1ZFS2_CULAL
MQKCNMYLQEEIFISRSLKSNHSMDRPYFFSNGPVTSDPSIFRKRSSSPDPSCVSLKSNHSMEPPPVRFSDGPVTSDPSIFRKRSSSPDPSCVSLKSNQSMEPPPVRFSDGPVTSDPSIFRKRSSSPDPSCVSLKSNQSMEPPPVRFSDGPVTSDPRDDQTGDQDSPQAVDDELQRVKDQLKTSMKNKYERLFEGLNLQENETLLNRIYTQLYIIEGESEGVNEQHEVFQMEKTARTQHTHDTPIYCNDIFKASPEPGREEKHQIKTVLTKGIAGIGKTVSVQKFILDWAEGKDNQDVDFMFVLPFRELNLIRDHQYSLHRLLLDFHPELQDLDSKIYEECKVVFIFDGLDESRITMMFSDAQEVSDVTESSSVCDVNESSSVCDVNESSSVCDVNESSSVCDVNESSSVSDVTETSSVGVLMSNLMKGELLPSALIWITSRPAAANQIPSKYINRLTEIQGFNEPQKEEYFRKRISDEHQASRIISHIRRARSLHIMCHIPVFCWISSTVLQKLLKEDLRAEIPQTLTEMYIHFLLIQINMRNQKYEERDPEKLLQSNREVIVKLAEVAFNQLMKGNVMFYEEDLRESGIDVTDASVYSGICTEIFKEESVIHQRKVYSFIHLSFQEFLAAFYVFYSRVFKSKKPLYKFRFFRSDKDPLYALLTSAVDNALMSENGQLDLFLRFLLGVSLESNQRLLQGLMTCTMKSSESIRRTTQYVQKKIKDEDLSTERSINLFLCLLEVKDQSLSREIQEFLKSDKHSEKKLSPGHCSTISYMIQMSEEPLDELNLMKYNTSAEGRRRLIPAVINCRKARFSGCNLTAQCCDSLSSALQSSNSVLRELDLSNNDLQDSGVSFISDGLKSPNCQLQILRLSGCMVTEEGCGYVSSALSSNPSHLRELDLSYNHPGQSGVQLLNHKLEDPNCKLQILNVDHGGEVMMTAGLRKYSHRITLDLNTVNKHLRLSERNTVITNTNTPQSYPDHPDRFDYPQVLCRESVCDRRCYWKIEWSGHVFISVSYKSISRKGANDECVFGYNDQSWSLICSPDRYSFRHNNINTVLPVKPIISRTVNVKKHYRVGVYGYDYRLGVNDDEEEEEKHYRVGVYVDHSAGTLSFYSVSGDTMILIHTVQTTFTQPLYPGITVLSGSSVKLF